MEASPSLVTIDLADKLSKIREPWRPKVVAELNGQVVQLARLEGTFVWHRHEAEDELFLPLEGRLRIEWKDAAGAVHAVDVAPGQLTVVPRGVDHRTIADVPTAVLLFEPASTRNTGNVEDERFTAPRGARI